MEIFTGKQYQQYKLKIKVLEEANFDKIILIPCKGGEGWYEIAEHSALFYYYEVCRKLNRKTKFFTDALSSHDQYKIGYMRTLGVENVRNRLMKVGLLKNEAKYDDMHVFELNKRYQKDEVKNLLRTELERREKDRVPEPTGTLNPTLHQLLAKTSQNLHGLCNQHLDKLSSRTNGEAIVKLIDNMLEEYHKIVMISPKAQKRIMEKLIDMRKESFGLIIKIRVISDAKLWDFETCAKETEMIVRIKELVENEIKKILAEEK